MKHFYEDITGYSCYAEQGILLETILKLINTQNTIKIAEIGVYNGKLTAMWNVELINRQISYEYYAIDHFKGSDGLTDVSYDVAISNLYPIKEHLKVINNNSIEESKNYLDNFFDIVYIDASHDYESVKNDLNHWYPKVKSGGIICGDDYSKYWKEVIVAVDEFFSQPINKIANMQWYVHKK